VELKQLARLMLLQTQQPCQLQQHPQLLALLESDQCLRQLQRPWTLQGPPAAVPSSHHFLHCWQLLNLQPKSAVRDSCHWHQLQQRLLRQPLELVALEFGLQLEQHLLLHHQLQKQ